MNTDPITLLNNLHNSFMSLHEERMKELNQYLDNFSKDLAPEKDETSEKLEQIGKDLEDLLK